MKAFYRKLGAVDDSVELHALSEASGHSSDPMLHPGHNASYSTVNSLDRADKMSPSVVLDLPDDPGASRHARRGREREPDAALRFWRETARENIDGFLKDVGARGAGWSCVVLCSCPARCIRTM